MALMDFKNTFLLSKGIRGLVLNFFSSCHLLQLVFVCVCVHACVQHARTCVPIYHQLDPIKTKELNRILSFFFPLKDSQLKAGKQGMILQCNAYAYIWSFCHC